MTITPAPTSIEETAAAQLGILAAYEEGLPLSFYNMHPRLEIIDGPTAAKYLERNRKPEEGVTGTNRSLRRLRVAKHVENIKQGRWRLTHQGIAFDTDGYLIDGQHRLSGIEQVGNEDPGFEGVPMVVWRGVPQDAFAVIDVAARRTLADALTSSGKTNGNNVGGALRLLWKYANCDFDTAINPGYWLSPLDNDIILSIMPGYPEIDDMVTMARRYAPVGTASRTREPILLASAVAAGRIIIERAYPDLSTLTDSFFDGLLTGVSLSDGSPVLALRRYGINQFRRGLNKSGYMHLAALLKAYRAYRLGTPMQAISVRAAVEPFPRP